MERSPNSVGNSSLISIRKAPLQKHATDTNRYEKTQTTTLSLDTLRGLARVIRAIKERLGGAGDTTK
jgi:hypothetical protein